MGHRSLSYVLTSERRKEGKIEREREQDGESDREKWEQQRSRWDEEAVEVVESFGTGYFT